jgi:hypothetical protein
MLISFFSLDLIETVGADLLQTLKPRVIGGLAYVTLVELAPLVVGMLMTGDQEQYHKERS